MNPLRVLNRDGYIVLERTVLSEANASFKL
ncbi:MAG: hypothetical protein ACI85I_002673 [Arenicella sp.]|jgi:hypothetical protein